MPDLIPGHPRARLVAFGLMLVALVLACSHAKAQQYDVYPGEDVHTIVRNAGEGATIRFAPGLYRLTKRIDPLNNQKFIGGEGVILSGAKVLTDNLWQRDSAGRWFVAGQTQEGLVRQVEGEIICQASAPRCAHPEMLFIEGVALEHVDAIEKLGPGKWFFDYGGNRILMADSPIGRLVEAAVVPCAICGGAFGVGVEGLEIRHFATPVENAAVEGFYVRAGIEGRGWVIENNLIHWNAAVGAVVRADGVIRNNRLLNNGQSGYGAGGQPSNRACGILVERNIIRGNGWKGVSPNFSSGGGKISYACNPVVQHNRSYENYDRRCYWFDLGNTGIVFQHNFAGDGCMSGVFFEMGGSATVEFNTFEGASIGGDSNQHAAILVTNSNGITIRRNTITLCDEGNAISIREDGGRPGFDTYNIIIEDNLIEFKCARGRAGWDAFLGASMPLPVFRRNTYHVQNVGYKHFNANNTLGTGADWQKLFSSEVITVEPIATQTPTQAATLQPIPATLTATPTMTAEATATPELRLVRRVVVRVDENGSVIVEEYEP